MIAALASLIMRSTTFFFEGLDPFIANIESGNITFGTLYPVIKIQLDLIALILFIVAMCKVKVGNDVNKNPLGVSWMGLIFALLHLSIDCFFIGDITNIIIGSLLIGIPFILVLYLAVVKSYERNLLFNYGYTLSALLSLGVIGLFVYRYYAYFDGWVYDLEFFLVIAHYVLIALGLFFFTSCAISLIFSNGKKKTK